LVLNLSPSRIYLDTSALMALVCPEPATDFVIGWFRQSQHDVLVYTPWLRTELSSALSIKLRSQQLRPDEVPVALQAAGRVLQTALCEPIETQDFDDAAQFCGQSDLKLRGPDALHLSAAKRLGCEKLASLDRLMCEVALKIGIEPVLPYAEQ
jgi:uncharacterized protein